MDDKHKTHDLSHGECAQCDDVLTHKKNRTRRTQMFVLMCLLCVEVNGSGHVVIGVGIVIVQCHHAIITNSEFSLLIQL